MEDGNFGDITLLLHRWNNGCTEALDNIITKVYHEMTRIGAGLMRFESPGHTLQAHGLVHEAFMRIHSLQSVEWKNRAHFYNMCAKVMRQVLVDYARRHHARKRGGEHIRVPYTSAMAQATTSLDIVNLIDSLERLEKKDNLLGQIVNLKYFAGLSIDEIANLLNISPSSVKRKWCMAQAWLYREMTECV